MLGSYLLLRRPFTLIVLQANIYTSFSLVCVSGWIKERTLTEGRLEYERVLEKGGSVLNYRIVLETFYYVCISVRLNPETFTNEKDNSLYP